MKLPAAAVGLLGLAFILTACPAEERERPAPEAAPGTQLTAFQLEHGIGPFTEEVTLPPSIDQELAAEGHAIFEMNCEVCHQMEGRFVGPPLGEVLERRTPTFILNMIMNPEQMVREHPEGQALLAEYPLVMPYQNISEEQARAILEYLRTEQR
jgi:cytochrome c